MEVVFQYTFVADNTYFEAEASLDKDPCLSMGDTVNAVPNMWPMEVEEVKYIIEEEKKIYSLHQMEKRIEGEDFHDKAKKSQKWNLYAHR